MIIEERNELVLRYIPLARKLAWKKHKTTPKNLQYEEIESAAYLGLVEAANKFDASKTVAFGFFAAFRINGAILDYLRELKWSGRNSDVEVQSLDSEVCPLSLFVADDSRDNDATEFFDAATSKLDEVGKNLINMYFFEGLSLKEIGKRIGVCESRVSQLLKKAKTALSSNWCYDELFSLAA